MYRMYEYVKCLRRALCSRDAGREEEYHHLHGHGKMSGYVLGLCRWPRWCVDVVWRGGNARTVPARPCKRSSYSTGSTATAAESAGWLVSTLHLAVWNRACLARTRSSTRQKTPESLVPGPSKSWCKAKFVWSSTEQQ